MTYDYPIYVVIPLGDASDRATDDDAAAVREAVAPFVAHTVVDKDACEALTSYLYRAVIV